MPHSSESSIPAEGVEPFTHPPHDERRNGSSARVVPVAAAGARSVEGVPSILHKAVTFTKADEMMAIGMYPYFRRIDSAQDTEVTIEGRRMLMLGSNSYMGLTNDPRIKEAAQKAVQQYGSGCAGSRFLNGTLDIHCALEDEIADYLGTEAALAFTTGFQANLGVISALVGKDDHVLIDRADHASIVDGCRLGFGRLHKFRHNDMGHLEMLLQRAEGGGRLIVVDGVYSMEGDIAPLPEIIALAKKYDAGILVDDAHSIGVLGDMGRGTANHFGVEKDVDLIVGTFSKSLASIGGFAAGSRATMNFLKHHARALIFSASIAPACVAAARKALEIIRTEPQRHEALWRNTNLMLEGLKHAGFNTGHSVTPIIPVYCGDMMVCFRFWRALHDAGIFVNPVVPPATPANDTLLRVSVMATHTEEQLNRALEVMERIGRETGVLQPA